MRDAISIHRVTVDVELSWTTMTKKFPYKTERVDLVENVTLILMSFELLTAIAPKAYT